MWVAAAARQSGRLGLYFQNSEGVISFDDAIALRNVVPIKATERLDATIKIHEGKQADVAAYLAALKSEQLSPSGQTCYAFEAEGLTFVIPSQLLIVSLLGATTLLRSALLTPQGPTALMTSYIFNSELVTTPTPKRQRQFQIDRTSAVARMEWVLQYTSARRAWSSVYANALKGVLDITLPSAYLSGLFSGVRSGNRLVVTRIEARRLIAGEKPMEFAHGAKSEWSLSAFT